jgi:uncharacterized membrane protein
MTQYDGTKQTSFQRQTTEDDTAPQVMLQDSDRTLGLNAIAAPWDYNPSAWRRRVPICILAGVAFVIASYMALYQWRLIDSVWDPVFGDQSQRVLDSDVSETMRSWLGIPDAALGALAYLADVIYCLAGSTRRWQYRPWMTILFGVAVLVPMVNVSTVLVVLQGSVVGHWCFLCLSTAFLSLTLVYMAYNEVWSCVLYLRRVWRYSRDAGLVWRIIWGEASVEADKVALQASMR